MRRYRIPLRYHGGGFTLLELLVVITIIGILLAVGLNAFKPNDAMQVGLAADQFESLARTAREQALAAGTPVLLAFHADGTDEERERRSIYLATRGDDGWVSEVAPESFPEGVYLDTEKSSGLLEGTFRPREGSAEIPFLGIVFRPDQFCEESGARFRFSAATREGGSGIKTKGTGFPIGFLITRTGHVVRWNPAADES